MKTCNFTTLKEKQAKEIQATTTNLYCQSCTCWPLVLVCPPTCWLCGFLCSGPKSDQNHLPSTTMLINLTVVDCLLFLVLPFQIVYHFQGNNWDLGEPFCRIVMAMFYGNIYSSVWCLALVALDRYVGLVHPCGAKTLRSQQMTLYMSGAVRLVMLAAMLPLLLSQQTYPLHDLNITTCHDALPESKQTNFFLPYFSTQFVICFLLPVIITCCTATAPYSAPCWLKVSSRVLLSG
ncbi:hypothetical protein XENORESO_020815 [Xenotaenia resolanae]|uniref:G-protein coupled receptors family 1 profile domain-containing protein n=1 Tax=Xenotaenia resolanae TaxID=208358 RepID=A0ABV0WBA4_9TELE